MSFLPDYIKRRRQWISWDLINGSKIPKQLNGQNARSNDPTTFVAFADVEAMEKKAYVIQEEDGLTGIDLDNCLVVNYETGEIEVKDWAQPIVDKLCQVAYGEISPSGTGIKFLTLAKKPEGARCTHSFGEDKEQVEVYDKTRFWTITEDYWLGSLTEVADGQEVVEWICREYLMPSRSQAKPAVQYRVAEIVSGPLLDRAVKYAEKVSLPAVGSRNTACFNLAGHLLSIVGEYGEKLTVDEVSSVVENWAMSQGAEPKDGEIRKAVESASKNGSPREEKRPQEIDTATDNSGVDLSSIGPKFQSEGTSLSLPATESKQQCVVYGLDIDQSSDESKFSESNQPTWAMQDKGMIGKIVEHTMRTALYPQPELAFAGALALMATITGQKITDRYNTRSNVYIIGMAPSGSGKEQARTTNKTLLKYAEGQHLIASERFASHAGIISSLAEQPALIFQIDEIGRLLQTMKNPTRNTHLYNIASVLMHLYSSSNQTWIGDAYADTTKIKTIHQPHAVLYGTTVAESFWGSLTTDNVSDGLLGRIMPFESAIGYVEPQTPETIEPADDLVDQVRWWVKQPGPINPESCDPPIKAVHSKDARERFESHMREIHNRHKNEDEQARALWSRAPGRAGKLSLLFAVSRQPETSMIAIELEDVERAIAVSNWLTRRVQKKVFDHVVENEQEERTKRVLRMLESPTTKSELSRRTQWLKKKERSEVLDTLFDSGQVVYWESQTGGKRPVTTYLKRSNFSEKLLADWLESQV